MSVLDVSKYAIFVKFCPVAKSLQSKIDEARRMF